MTKAKPFVKWAGGKRNILKEIKEQFPAQFENYYEPFVGGGAVFFDLQHHKSFISDLNLELITTYLVIQNDVKNLINLLEGHQKKHSKSYFYNIREKQFLEDPIEIAARFIYLNKTCYNGLYRVNRKNEFNSPIGDYENPNICDEENLLLCHEYLQKVEIKHQSYDQIKPKKGDFVYLDPPYHNTFLGYNAIKFDGLQQTKLKQFCDQLRKNEVEFKLSNADNDFIRELYEDYNVVEITALRSMNRSKTKELLIF